MQVWLTARAAAVTAACCLTVGLVAGATGLPAAPAAVQAASDTGAVYVPVGPVRLLDTRNGTGGYTAPVGPGGTISLQITGADGGVVPSSGVTAVVLNVTATDPTDSSFITVYPDGTSLPTASNLNFTAAETIANLVTVPVGADGAVDFYNHTGSVNLVADLEGYYTTSGTGSLFDSIAPVRVLDTRNGTGGYSAPVGPGGTISLQVAGVDDVPATGVTAVVLNVTATDPTDSSFITAYPDGSTLPTASNLNFTAGETIPNLVVVPVGAAGAVDFFNHTGSVNLVADLEGYYYSAGSQYTPLGPVRVLDTRNGTGGYSAPVGPGGTISLQVAGMTGVPATGVTAVVLNVTATDPTDSSFITAYPDGQPLPGTSNLNFTAGETIPNLVTVPVGADGKVDLYNHTGSVNLVADLEGYYTTSGTPWGDAIEVPGTAALATGGAAGVTSVSCPSAGNCTAGGSYFASSSSEQAFVVDEVDGTWGTAVEVPGTAALNTNSNADYAWVTSVSCASAGNCVAGGEYDGSDDAFVADEVNGTWGDAIEVPGVAALTADSADAGVDVTSVSCASAGNCAIGGWYADNVGAAGVQAWVADEVNSAWGDATEVPGTAAVNTGGYAKVLSISCASAGNCAAGGEYSGSGGFQAFVADEVNGTWGSEIEVPGTAGLNAGGDAGITSVSCPSAGTCAAGGYYDDSSNVEQAFLADEVNGTWGDATEVPGTPALDADGYSSVISISCASAGNCSAGGDLAVATSASSVTQPFVISEVNGIWGSAIQLADPAAYAGNDLINSVSCASAGNCAAVGSYEVSATQDETFAVSEVNGTWGESVQVPGPSTGSLEVGSVSCPPTGSCAAGGDDFYGSFDSQAYVVSQN